jgi:hypothetical protein
MTPAARVLGIPASKLRRWVNEGRFEHIPGMEWRENGFQKERVFSRSWVAAVAKDRNLKADFDLATGDSNA